MTEHPNGPPTRAICYDGKRFRPVGLELTGTGSDVVATYRQSGDLLWGEFAGGPVRRGTLVGTCGRDGSLDFAYCMVEDAGLLISGRCHSTPEILPDGRIRLSEDWHRFLPRPGSGVSQLEETRAGSSSTTDASAVARSSAAAHPAGPSADSQMV